MRLFLIFAIIAIFTALQMPALAALGIENSAPVPAVESVVPAPAPPPAAEPAWSSSLQDQTAPAAPAVSAPSQAVVVSTPTPAQPAYVVVEAPKAEPSNYFKSEQDMKVLNTTVYNYRSFANQQVPEPGSVLVLSTGLVSIFQGLRRARRRA